MVSISVVSDITVTVSVLVRVTKTCVTSVTVEAGRVVVMVEAGNVAVTVEAIGEKVRAV